MNYTYEIKFSTEGQGENGININLKITNLNKVCVKLQPQQELKDFSLMKL